MSPHAPVWAIVAALVVTGPGMGGCLIGSMMGAQNALGARDIGSGTAALLVLRSVGGAAGSTLAGAIIAAGLTAARVTGSGASAAAGQLGSYFAMVYAMAALLAAIAFLVALRMPNTRLRETVHAASGPGIGE